MAEVKHARLFDETLPAIQPYFRFDYKSYSLCIKIIDHIRLAVRMNAFELG